MSRRGLGVALALLGVGIATGFVVGNVLSPEPASITTAAPVPAESPSYPVDPVHVLPDPTNPPLEPALDAHYERVGQEPFTLRIPVPDTWSRTNSNLGEWKWFLEGTPLNTYLLRVKLVGNQNLTIPSALSARIDALAGATQQFTMESRTVDTFIATYVNDNYRRLTMERFISVTGDDSAYATIAVIGREVDRAGLSDLLERVTDGATQ